MPPLIDLKNKVFGSLMVRCRAEDHIRPSGDKVPQWYCVCLCGNVTIVEGADLRTGTTRSCGCHIGCCSGHKNETHGESKSPEYSILLDIHRRCYDIKDRFYANYGGRGIFVCERWHKSNISGVKNFIEDMGRRPSTHHTIERKDVNRGYSPDNCIWILNTEQCKNKTTSRKFSYMGITLIQSDWAKVLSVTSSRIQYHIWSGKSFEETVYYLSKKYCESLLGLEKLLKGETGGSF